MTLKIDKSLAEVLEWRAKSQQITESMSPEEQITYIHQKAQDFMHRHNLHLIATDSSGRKRPYPPPLPNYSSSRFSNGQNTPFDKLRDRLVPLC
jgi:hypothetical protein